ncbi:hypothetical protein KM427_23955 [Nocardioides sp. LMS-CY]|uniref:hypothetical protein n=1 Tax=Nocardioides sp. (strain LMS-CY) TaxID=2840457 RepID=UPI001C005AC8|nr:hypothetical protein [Nocardioides sp. LMS-CY]QWF21923.1 hypothetical protein KM427_23955 [Nocardioides sp. LMS-CY]
MARRTAYLHIGLPGSGGGFVETALVEHSESLTEMGVQHPTITDDEMFRAAVEIRRDHRAWGYQRREVEGTWAEICRRTRRGSGPILLSQELLAACTDDQAALLLDTLDGHEVHVVVTARRADAERHELADLARRWARAVGGAERVHVLVAPTYVEPRAWIWSALGELVGFDAARLPLPAPGLPPHLMRSLAQATGRDLDGDTPTEGEDQLWWASALLSATLVEVARLREQERALAERNAKLERKRRRPRRRLADA